MLNDVDDGVETGYYGLLVDLFSHQLAQVSVLSGPGSTKLDKVQIRFENLSSIKHSPDTNVHF